ncbi:large ribosomal subunit protein bL21-like [Oscarella lobularis]|uniref:large ribosomal subunit protein bL21-like n=1 Tax=Oscarella lobularis TaxID=121494 RepID=UPI003313DB13
MLATRRIVQLGLRTASCLSSRLLSKPLTSEPLVTWHSQSEQSNSLKEAARAFAVVHLAGRQHKITEDDTVAVNKLDVETGAKIRLEKVLLAGTSDLTLIGTPLLSKSLVQVEATVVEQTKSERMLVFKKKRRKNYKRKRGYRQDITVLRINRINLPDNSTQN